ncbi:MAG: hypothetical protein HYY17_06020 [Planctomycetes bacterium]|nr:hypothetical protein [Planctomycetota bacterium]
MRRRLITNLTPLLDMVLLVLFAYQIQSSFVLARTATTARSEAEIRRDTEDSARRVARENEALRGEREKLLRELEELREKNRSLEEHVRQIARVLHGMFGRVPEDQFFRAMAGASREDARKIREALDRWQSEPAEAVLRRLARIESYNRHVTSWMVHLRDEHSAEVRLNDGPPVRLTLSSNEAELRSRIGKAFAEFEEPKDLVIVFFSWGRLLKTQKDLVEDVLEILTQDALRIRYPNKRFYLTREGYRAGE